MNRRQHPQGMNQRHHGRYQYDEILLQHRCGILAGW
jgi:hypothetical protein